MASPRARTTNSSRSRKNATPPESSADPIHQIRETFKSIGLPGSPERAALAQALERASRSVHAGIEATLRPFELSRPRFELLSRLLSRPEGEHLGRLGNLLFVHPATITNLVDRLDAAGLIERRAAEGDRRAIVAKITPKGEQIARTAFRALADDQFALGHLTADEVSTLRGLLVKLFADRPA